MSATNAGVLFALEAAWAAITAVHPDLPNARIILASGVKGKKYDRRGHWWPETWSVDDTPNHEVMIATEHLAAGAELVMETLLHEAAHGLAYARGIKDTSRNGRWHNGRFASLAKEVGIVVETCTKIGHRTNALAEGTADVYAVPIAALRGAIGNAYRKKPGAAVDGAEKEKKPKKIKLTCGCGRCISTDEETLALGTIQCGECETPFEQGA